VATLIELQTELTEVKTAISFILKGGQSYTISSGAGGSSRTVTMGNLAELNKMKSELEMRIANLQGRSAFKMRPGW
jgi:hypothetical protein